MTPNRSEAGGRPTSRRTSTAWISFFARERARTSCSRRDSRRRITRQRSSGDQTASSSPAANSLASVRASRRSVFARAWRIPVSAGLTTTTRATWRSRIRATSQALPLTPRAPPDRAGEGLRRTAPVARASCRPDPPSAPHHPARSRPHRNRGARPTRWPYRPISPRPPLVVELAEKQRANDNDRYELTAHPGKSQGRPLSMPGLEAHRPKRPAPLRSP